MKNIFFKSTAIVMIVMLVSSTAFAQGGAKHKKGKKGNSHFMKIPDLTDVQQEKMKKLHTSLAKEMLPLKNQLGEKEARMKTVSTGDNVKMNEVYAVIDEISAIKTNMAKKKAAHRQEIREILTDDQKVWFDMHAPTHGKRMGHHKKGRHGKKHHKGNKGNKGGDCNQECPGK